MKFCSFGTIRVDIHTHANLAELGLHDEIKTDNVTMQIGGSVYNTSAVLAELGQSICMYRLHSNDNLAEYIGFKSSDKIRFVSSSEDDNQTATSLIFVDQNGEKKMISCDGKRNDNAVLELLNDEIEQYDAFVTSFYEITNENVDLLENIMKRSKMNVVDLSPMIYACGVDLCKRVLAQADILTGTESEFEKLKEIVGFLSIDELQKQYAIERIFKKCGARGAVLYSDGSEIAVEPDKQIHSFDTTGCGDTFTAGVLEAIANGKSSTEALHRGVLLAGAVAEHGLDMKYIQTLKKEQL